MAAGALLPFVAFTTILIASLLSGHWIHVSKFRYATEGSAAMVLATTLAGTVWLLWYAITKTPLPQTTLKLPDTVFFNILLPPIIFYAGFSIKKRMFFQNFATIFAFGFLGTLASAAGITAAATAALHTLGLAPKLLMQSALALGAVCACSDTVAILQIVDKSSHPVLHSIIFGEGIVNDAVAVVLLGAVNSMTSSAGSGGGGSLLEPEVLLDLVFNFLQLFGCSLCLGVSIGLLSALLIRHVFGRVHDCDREVLLLALLGYMAYLLADAADLSPILSVFFCGVTMSHYSWHSMGAAAQALAIHTFRVASSLMEMILYAYSGINIWTSALWQPDGSSRVHLKHALSLAFVLLVAIIAVRVCFTYLAVAAGQLYSHSCRAGSRSGAVPQHISWLDATVITVGGLSRGAITLALAYHHFGSQQKGLHAADQQVMILAVVVVVLVSTLSLGALTGPLMQYIMAQHKQQQHTQHLQQQRHQQRHQQHQHQVMQTGTHQPAGSADLVSLDASDGGADLSTPLLQQQHYSARYHTQKQQPAGVVRPDVEAGLSRAAHQAELTAAVVAAATPMQDVDAAALGTYLALSQVPSPGTAVSAASDCSIDAASPVWWRPASDAGSVAAVTSATGALGPATLAPGSDASRQQQQQQQLRQRSLQCGSGSGTPPLVQQQWYLRQQWLLLQQQMTQLQLEQQEEEQQQHGPITAASDGEQQAWTFRSVWQFVDRNYMQPVFGGREMAMRMAMIPREFEDFGVGS